MEPDGGRGIDSIPAGEILENDLAQTGHDTGTDEHSDSPQGRGALNGGQQVSAGTAPRQVLHKLQNASQQSRTDSRADAGKQNRQPKERGTGTPQTGRNGIG
jgi:hypothetical protein